MQHMLAKELQAQETREDVARLTLEKLEFLESDDPDPNSIHESSNIEEEWFAKFDRVVEGVSSDEMKQLLARILAGEIKREGSFSLRTLRFVSELDRRSIEIFEELASLHLGDTALFVIEENWNKGPNYDKVKLLLDYGLITELAGSSARESIPSKDGNLQIFFGIDYTLILESENILDAPIILLSQVGRELLPMLSQANEIDTLSSLAEYLKETYPGKIERATIYSGARKSNPPRAIVKVVYDDS